MRATIKAHRPIGRNVQGQYLPSLLISAAVGLMVAAAVLSSNAARQGVGLMCGAISLLTMIAAALVEIDIRREMRLANVGEIAEANVTEVHIRRSSGGEGYGWMRYFFTTGDGQTIEKTSYLTYLQTAWITAGSPLQILYDPAKPKRCTPVENLRMVDINLLPQPPIDFRDAA